MSVNYNFYITYLCNGEILSDFICDRICFKGDISRIENQLKKQHDTTEIKLIAFSKII